MTPEEEALAQRIRAVLRLISPDHISPMGRRQIENVLAEAVRGDAPGGAPPSTVQPQHQDEFADGEDGRG